MAATLAVPMVVGMDVELVEQLDALMAALSAAVRVEEKVAVTAGRMAGN